MAIVLLGAGGVCWSTAAFRVSPDFGMVRDLSSRVGRGDAYRVDSIRARADAITLAGRATCDPAFLTGGLIIQVRAAENEIAAANLTDLDRRLEDVERTATHLLACAPAQSYGWLVLFWVRSFRTGAFATNVPLLAESYRTGPGEAWIQVRRAPLAMIHYNALPEEMRKLALAEYSSLISSSYIDLVTSIYARLDGATRQAVLTQLKGINRGARVAFARSLDRAGFDIDLAGLMERPDRPWLH